MMKKILLLPLILLATVAYTQQGQRITIRDFSGGLNTRMSPNQLPNDQASTLKNLLVDEKPGSLVTRDGYTLASSTNATELFEYKKSNGEVFLVKHYQGTVEYSANEGKAWQTVIEGLKWELNPLRAVVFDDYLVLSNGIDDVIVFDGSGTSQLDFIPRGKYLISHYNRLFIANTWEDPDRVYYSVIGEDITEEDAWESLNYEVIGGNISGVATYRDQLILFTESETWAILGSNPWTWRVVKINTNYGCIQHESIAIDKGILKFLSKSGLKGYNGSSIQDIDFPIQDIVLNSNNIRGEYAYLIYNRTRDFSIYSSTGINIAMNEIKLNEYENEWVDDDLDGTLSNIMYSNGVLQLSTSTSITLKTYKRTSETNEWGFDKLYFADGTGFLCDNGDENNAAVISDPTFTSERITYSGNYSTGYNIRNINILADFSLRTRLNTQVKGRKTRDDANARRYARAPLKTGPVKADLYMDVGLLFETESDPNYIQNKRIATLVGDAVTPLLLNRYKTHKDEYTYDGLHRKTTRRSFKTTINIPISGVQQKIIGVDIAFSIKMREVDFTNPNSYIYKTSIRGIRFQNNDVAYRFNKIFNTEMKYTDETEEYEPSGTFELAEQKVADRTVEFGSMTVYGRWDGVNTDVDIYTKSDNDADWVAVELDTSTFDTGGYVSGRVNSVAGRAIAVKGTFSTSVSSYTPRITSIYIDSVEQSGSITLAESQISKVNGGWSYAIFSEDTDITQPTTYYVRLGTSSDSMGDWQEIETTDIIPGTTDHVFIQYKVDMMTDDGTQNPKVFSIVSMYIPETAPVWSSAISINDRYHISLSTSGTENNIILVHGKNNSWTLFDIPVRSFTPINRDFYFSNSDGINKLYDGTDDAGAAINSKYERVINADFSFDHRLSEIITTGQQQSDGALNVSYRLANSTFSFTASGIDKGDGGRFRHRQPSGGVKSAVQDWTLTYTSTSPVEINVIELWPDVIGEFTE